MPDLLQPARARAALARWENDGSARAAMHAALPGPVFDLVKRLGVKNRSCARRVTLTQLGHMRLGRKARHSRFRARQMIDVGETEFEWRASFGPFGGISVTDVYRGGAGSLDVRLFNLIRLAHMAGPAFAKGEIMRYLAEIAWAPDAILLNRSLVWSIIDDRTLMVAAGTGAGYGSVRIDLDDEGRIGGIFAPDRQFTEGKIVEERPWSGQFLDYRRCLGRWLPYGAEVGWTIDGQAQKYWRGAITSWTVA